MNKTNLYKVVLVFNLTEGSANEELTRSEEENSFPKLLAKQPGFVEFELVKIIDEKTLSIQTWETEKNWWAALEAVKSLREELTADNLQDDILVSREFLGGCVRVHCIAAEA